LQEYSRLATISVSAGEASYKLRPKFHYFAHVVLELPFKRENPRRYDLFGAEDFIGKMKCLAKTCDRRTVMRRIADRYIFVVSHDWFKRTAGGTNRKPPGTS
jgi:hypothetical protein